MVSAKRALNLVKNRGMSTAKAGAAKADGPCLDLKPGLPERSASCPNSQRFRLLQPLRIEDNPRSGSNQGLPLQPEHRALLLG
jgi:hypothetical protein